MEEDIVSYLSRLAKLKVSEEVSSVLKQQIEGILHYMSILDEVSTEGVSPTHHVHENRKITLRPDVEKKTLSSEEYLKNAPSTIGTMVRIPTVIKGK